MKKVGGLWTKNSKNNKKYLEGTIELICGLPIKIIIMKNDKKTGNQPDFNILLPSKKNDSSNVKVLQEDIYD